MRRTVNSLRIMPRVSNLANIHCRPLEGRVPISRMWENLRCARARARTCTCTCTFLCETENSPGERFICLKVFNLAPKHLYTIPGPHGDDAFRKGSGAHFHILPEIPSIILPTAILYLDHYAPPGTLVASPGTGGVTLFTS